MLVVVVGTDGFLFAVLLNVFAVCQTAVSGAWPAVSKVLDQRLLAVPVWAGRLGV